MLKKLLKSSLIKPLFNNLTAGENINSLINKIQVLNQSNLYSIVDYIKESSNNEKEVIKSLREYIILSKMKEIKYIAIKLSTFQSDSNYKLNFLIDKMIENNKTILIDAENVDKQDKINELTNKYIEKYNIDEIKIFKTYQMYRKDSYEILKDDIKKFNNLGIKLVRGAYHNQDKHTSKLFLEKNDTDIAFDKSMDLIFNTSYNQAFICTHNQDNINKMIDNFNSNPRHYENKIFHASLYGFINNDTERIVKSGIKTFKYLPYGPIDDAVPYLTRRLYENPKILFYLFK